MPLPDWRTLTVNDGILMEAVPDGGRLVLWLPEEMPAMPPGCCPTAGPHNNAATRSACWFPKSPGANADIAKPGHLAERTAMLAAKSSEPHLR
jgi:hypothetical protein